MKLTGPLEIAMILITGLNLGWSNERLPPQQGLDTWRASPAQPSPILIFALDLLACTPNLIPLFILLKVLLVHAVTESFL